MARPEKKLSIAAVKAAKPTDTGKAARYSDGGGLYLHVTPSGGKSWVYVWKKHGRKREMGLGAFALKGGMSLLDAREKATECRQMVAEGKDPIVERDRWIKKEPTFKECADRHYEDKIEFKVLPNGKTSGLKNEKSRQQHKMTIETYAKPLHDLKVSQITIQDVLGVLRPIWDTKRETASRLQGRIERILSYATALGWREGPNPAAWTKNLDNILPPKPTAKEQKNHPALHYDDMPTFMADLRTREAIAALLVEFAILTVARSGQARAAMFSEINMETGFWSIPKNKMKNEIAHIVPLCSRALEIVGQLSETPLSDYIFINPNNRKDGAQANKTAHSHPRSLYESRFGRSKL